MLTVYNCLVEDHDLRLVFLAGIVCAISALTAVMLLKHIRAARGHIRTGWIAVAAAAIGFGIWATHFVAMLAFAPGIPSAYDIALTLASLAIATLITGVGIAIATRHDTIDHHLVGGAVIGGGIAAMHFVGMAAYEVQGRIVWDQRLVATALVCGIALGALAIRVVLARPDEEKAGNGTTARNIAGALTLTLAICSLHFIGMGAVTIAPDTSVAISPSSVPETWLAIAVACAAFTILLLSAVALWVDMRDLRHAELEESRMHALADAAFEGLVVCEGRTIVTANSSFLKLCGHPVDAIVGRSIDKVLRDLDAVQGPVADGHASEQTVLHADGSLVPIKVLAREIDYRGAPHTVYAVRDLRETKKAEAEIRHLALHDPLTGLPNRRSFQEKLAAEIAAHRPETGRSIALLCLDLDRFKEVNDLFGHGAGDAMLQQVAHCVGGILRPGQMLARLGGDEFAIVAPDLENPADAAEIAEAILTAFRDENQRAANEGLMSTSIGISIYPGDCDDGEALIGHADTALYRAKSEGRDTFRFYEQSMGQEVRQRRMLEHELRHAVARNEFHLVYQPQKKLDTGETIGYEALLRWTHPERGNVSPAVFVPLAEESGAIVSIGEWVLETACTDAAKWDSEVTVAVNVSPIQLHSPDFARTVHRTLLRTGLAANRLEIEITETALVRDMNRALATLRQIKALGVRVAMDDFGTGYSSLSNLRAFPFDKIKIDGSFIRSVDRNEQAATIVKAVLGIGRGLGLPVLAEGVETSEELNFLAGEFCQIGQGYLLGRPARIEAMDDADARSGEGLPAAVA